MWIFTENPSQSHYINISPFLLSKVAKKTEKWTMGQRAIFKRYMSTVCFIRARANSRAKHSNNKVLFMTSSFFRSRRNMFIRVALTEGTNLLQKMKPFWTCVFLILTLLGTSSGSVNTKEEGKFCKLF